MNATELWQAVENVSPERVARIAHQVGEVTGTAQDFVDRLSDLSINASIANGRCGYVGNPYEKLDEDYVFLLSAAERASGLKARHPWQRQ